MVMAGGRRGGGGVNEGGEAFIFSDVAVFSSADAMPVDLASAVFVFTCCAFHTLREARSGDREAGGGRWEADRGMRAEGGGSQTKMGGVGLG